MPASHRIRSFLLGLVGTVSVVGCAAPASAPAVPVPPQPQTHREPSAPQPVLSFPRVDDLVLAQQAGGSFGEARVERIKGARVLVTWTNASPPSEVFLSDVVPLPTAGTPPLVKQGDYVLTTRPGQRGRWEGAVVTDVQGDVFAIRVSAVGIKHAHVGSDRIAAVPPVIAATLKADAEKIEFMQEAKRHRPMRPPAYRPKVGDGVVALNAGDDWGSGTVEAIKADKITVAWKEDEEPARISSADVVPAPDPHGNPRSRPGGYVLVREGSRWTYARVDAVSDAGIRVISPDGDKRSVAAGEFIILE